MTANSDLLDTLDIDSVSPAAPMLADGDFDLDLTVIEGGPSIADALRMTDDGCGTTCQSACPATCP
jgi:FxLD family lantipeptide